MSEVEARTLEREVDEVMVPSMLAGPEDVVEVEEGSGEVVQGVQQIKGCSGDFASAHLHLGVTR